jgi:hypothetical protein
MSRGRRNQLTGQIAEHLVCAELGRLGLAATAFAGNIPTFDVLATDELCRTVPIQVKATNSDNWPSDARTWMQIDVDPDTQKQRLHGPANLVTPDLVYVCVAVAPPRSERRDRFFVLLARDLQSLCIAGYSAWMETKQWKRPRNPHSFDCRYDIAQLLPFENHWRLIQERLANAVPDPSLAALDATALAPTT